MWRHILPNAFQPVIVYGTIAVGGVILAEAALSFLGVGVQRPTPSLGLMVADGQRNFVNSPHLLFFPGVRHLHRRCSGSCSWATASAMRST